MGMGYDVLLQCLFIRIEDLDIGEELIPRAESYLGNTRCDLKEYLLQV